jgi:hypothetical protein
MSVFMQRCIVHFAAAYDINCTYAHLQDSPSGPRANDLFLLQWATCWTPNALLQAGHSSNKPEHSSKILSCWPCTCSNPVCGLAVCSSSVRQLCGSTMVRRITASSAVRSSAACCRIEQSSPIHACTYATCWLGQAWTVVERVHDSRC